MYTATLERIGDAIINWFDPEEQFTGFTKVRYDGGPRGKFGYVVTLGWVKANRKDERQYRMLRFVAEVAGSLSLRQTH